MAGTIEIVDVAKTPRASAHPAYWVLTVSGLCKKDGNPNPTAIGEVQVKRIHVCNFSTKADGRFEFDVLIAGVSAARPTVDSDLSILIEGKLHTENIVLPSLPAPATPLPPPATPSPTTTPPPVLLTNVVNDRWTVMGGQKFWIGVGIFVGLITLTSFLYELGVIN